MKLVYAGLLSLTLTACGNAPGTTSEMQGKGSNASNLSATDSNGMGHDGTTSGTTVAPAHAPAPNTAAAAAATAKPGADDPAAHANDTGNAAEKRPEDPKAAAVKNKMDATRPGTSDDTKRPAHK